MLDKCKKFTAEFLGTFLLCYIGCGAAVLNSSTPAIGPIIFVFLIGGLGSAFGPISGAHLNPSVSLIMLMTGKMTIFEFVYYNIAQFTGAFSGFGCLYQLLSNINNGKVTNLACNGYGELSPLHINASIACLVETTITCFFTFVILVASNNPAVGAKGPFIVGFTLGCVAYFSGNLTGGSMNPARSLAPAVIMGGTALKQVWVFMIFPMVGAFTSANLYMFLMGGNKKPEKKDVYVEMKDKE